MGSVSDSSGARIPSASIVLQAAGSPIERKTTANARGEFRFSDVPAGLYRVIVNAAGFAAAESDVTLHVSSVREIDVTLVPAASTQSVNV